MLPGTGPPGTVPILMITSMLPGVSMCCRALGRLGRCWELYRGTCSRNFNVLTPRCPVGTGFVAQKAQLTVVSMCARPVGTTIERLFSYPFIVSMCCRARLGPHTIYKFLTARKVSMCARLERKRDCSHHFVIKVSMCQPGHCPDGTLSSVPSLGAMWRFNVPARPLPAWNCQ